MTKAPKHLSSVAKRHMRRLESDYEFSSDQTLILITAMEHWDMANSARELMQTEGIVKAGRRHPAAEVLKQATAVYLRCFRELGLNRGDAGDPGRPPSEVEV